MSGGEATGLLLSARRFVRTIYNDAMKYGASYHGDRIGLSDRLWLVEQSLWWRAPERVLHADDCHANSGTFGFRFFHAIR